MRPSELARPLPVWAPARIPGNRFKNTACLVVKRDDVTSLALACEVPVWVRADLRDGLWQTTPWATWTLEARLPELEQALRASVAPAPPYLGGFVLSSGALLAQGEVSAETCRTDTGAIGMRYPLAPVRGREVIVVPFADAGSAALFERAYLAEPGWLAGALAAASLPTTDHLFARANDLGG